MLAAEMRRSRWSEAEAKRERRIAALDAAIARKEQQLQEIIDGLAARAFELGVQWERLRAEKERALSVAHSVDISPTGDSGEGAGRD